MKISQLALMIVMVITLSPDASAMCATKTDCAEQPIDATFRTRCNFSSPGDNPATLSAKKGGKTVTQCKAKVPRMGVEDQNGTQVLTFECGSEYTWQVDSWSRRVQIDPQDVDGEISVTYGGVTVKVAVKAKQYCAVYFPVIVPDSGTYSGGCGGGNGVDYIRNCNL